MSKEKYYFENEDDEFCYTAEYFIENGITEVYEAKKDKLDNHTMFCKEHLEFGETGECGQQCEDYDPCNGKSGKCKHYSKMCYTPTGKKINLNNLNERSVI